MINGHSKFRGFSLVELLFSMTIGSIILIAAIFILNRSNDDYNRMNGNIFSDREARSAMTQLTSDFATACYHKDMSIISSTISWPTDRVGFLSLKSAYSQTDTGHIGDLCSVNYYVKDLIINGKMVRCLMRGFSASSDTFDALKIKNLSSLFKENPSLDEPIAFGVLSFEARLRVKDDSGKWIEWEKNGELDPQRVEIKLVIVRREMMGRLIQSQDWDGTSNAGIALGKATESGHNKNLEVYQAMLSFGNDAE